MKFQPACSALLFLGVLHVVHETNASCLTFSEYLNRADTVTNIICVKGENNNPPTIPATIAALTNLVELRIVGDELEGTLPTELALMTKLTSIEIEDNPVVGTIPFLSALTALTMLKLVNLPTFTPGPIPDIFDTMPNFRSVSFYNTKRTGTIPVSLTTRPLIEFVRLGKNSLNGTISDTLGNATDLRYISLFDNQFTGRVPKGVARPNVNTIKVQYNQFSGTLDGYGFPSYSFDELRAENTRMYGKMPNFNLNQGGQSDITPGESLGDFIANGETCVGLTDKCSSGATSCGAVNNICCAPIYTAPNVRIPCASGVCIAGTGACQAMPTPLPTAQPTALPTTSSPVSVPTSGDVDTVIRPPPAGDDDGAEAVLQIGLGVGTALAAVSVLFVAKRRQNKANQHGSRGRNQTPSAWLYGNGSAASFASGATSFAKPTTSLYTGGSKTSVL